MRSSRRRFMHLIAGAAALPCVSRIGWAQTYPTRPVRVIVGFPAGGVGDILARLLGQWLSERLGQPFVIENRPGAATNLAAEAVVRSPPDGHTLLWITAANAINASLYDKLSFNFIRDIAPVASFVRGLAPVVFLLFAVSDATLATLTLIALLQAPPRPPAPPPPDHVVGNTGTEAPRHP